MGGARKVMKEWGGGKQERGGEELIGETGELLSWWGRVGGHAEKHYHHCWATGGESSSRLVCWLWYPGGAQIEKAMATSNSQNPGVRTHFKTPEGRYSLSHEKTHPTGLLHYNIGKAITQVRTIYSKILRILPLQLAHRSNAVSIDQNDNQLNKSISVCFGIRLYRWVHYSWSQWSDQRIYEMWVLEQVSHFRDLAWILDSVLGVAFGSVEVPFVTFGVCPRTEGPQL